MTATSKRRLLLVEDDPTTHRALEGIFRRRGWLVTTAATLEEAMQSLEADSWDAVILDLMLPDGEGERVLRRVREKGADTRVVVTTGSDDAARLKRVNELRPDALLFKPLDLMTLLEHLEPS